jgi:hypothetical protein
MGYAYNASAQLARIVQLQNVTETARWTLGYNEQGDVQRLTYTDATTIDPTTLAPTETTQPPPPLSPSLDRPSYIPQPLTWPKLLPEVWIDFVVEIAKGGKQNKDNEWVREARL